MTTQNEQLERVSDKIAPAIFSFQDNVGIGGHFSASALHNFVDGWIGYPLAPGSADRILRRMRQRGDINYVVVDRQGSLYQFIELDRKAPKFEDFAI